MLMQNVESQTSAVDVVPVTVRKATLRDIEWLACLINGYAADGIMLPRTQFELSENIRDFSLAETIDGPAACGALHFYSPTAAEIRSVAVQRDLRRTGMGLRVVEAIEAEAQSCGIRLLFAFTYLPRFFAKAGFLEVERGALPLKAWKDCLRCPKSQSCDETAMVKWLPAASPDGRRAVASLEAVFEFGCSPELIYLPENNLRPCSAGNWKVVPPESARSC
jgi:amino-acid N-acetyltransferase